jgi:phospholipase C
MTTGLNVGDLLNAAGVTWGFFQGGFAPTSYTSTGKAVCHSSHVNMGGATVTDYSPDHQPSNTTNRQRTLTTCLLPLHP